MSSFHINPNPLTRVRGTSVTCRMVLIRKLVVSPQLRIQAQQLLQNESLLSARRAGLLAQVRTPHMSMLLLRTARAEGPDPVSVIADERSWGDPAYDQFKTPKATGDKRPGREVSAARERTRRQGLERRCESIGDFVFGAGRLSAIDSTDDAGEHCSGGSGRGKPSIVVTESLPRNTEVL